MGWGSAGQYFDLVAVELDDNGVDEDAQYNVLLGLAKALRNDDWDTMEESLEGLSGLPAVVRVMAYFGYKLSCDCKCCDHGEDS